jgi:signal transduction histidine kinase
VALLDQIDNLLLFAASLACILAGLWLALRLRRPLPFVALVALGVAGVARAIEQASGDPVGSPRDLAADAIFVGAAGAILVLALALLARLRTNEATRALEAALNAEKALRARDHALVQQERLATIGTLMASVGHEIGNALTGLRTNVATQRTVLEGAPPSGGYVEAATLESLRRTNERFARSAATLGDLAEGMKRNARGGRGSPVRLAPDALVANVLAVAQGRLKHDYVVEKDLRACAFVEGNEGELSQVLLNLILNAAEAMAGQPEPRRIRIHSREEPGQVVLAVHDNGPGIPADVQGRLFTAFYTTKPSGTGLGLYLSRKIVEDHGGTLSVASELGQGATFSIALPSQPTSLQAMTGAGEQAGPAERARANSPPA